MKITAKVKLKGQKNAECLLRSFFTELNSESSIVIDEQEARLELVFDNPPLEIIKAISFCEIIEFNYGKDLSKTNNESKQADNVEPPVQEKEEADNVELPVQEKEEADNVELPVQEKEEADNVELPVQEKEETDNIEAPQQEKEEVDNVESPVQEKEETDNIEPPVKTNVERFKQMECKKNTEILEITEISNFAEKSTSHEEFVSAVAVWLELGERQEVFENFVKAAMQIEKVNWKNIKDYLSTNKFFYSEWDKIWCTTQVATKFKESKNPVTILNLIKVLAEYKDFEFHENSVQTKPKEVVVDNQERVLVKKVANNSKKKARMKCFPEIPWFEELLGSVDKTRPLEERIECVLSAMGWENNSIEEKKKILEMSNIALNLKNISFDAIFLKSKISKIDPMYSRMIFSKFVNDFAAKNHSQVRVKVIDFLKELQSILLSQSELESVSDFTN